MIELLFGVLNAFRGSGNKFFSKGLTSIYMASVLYCLTGVPEFIATFPLFWLGFSYGWGKYFMAFHGRNYRHEKEFPPADWILKKLKIRNNHIYGIIGMGIRWQLMFLPLFVGLIYISMSSWYYMAYSLYFLFIGLIYYIVGHLPWGFKRFRTIRTAEFLVGAYVGMVINVFI